MKFEEFYDERASRWAELERLVDRAGSSPRRLPPADLRRLGALHRSVTADLAMARRRFAGQSVIGSGTAVEYGDKFDTMGSANAGSKHFNARYKNFLNWLTSADVTNVAQSGTYRLFAHDADHFVRAAVQFDPLPDCVA